MKLNPSFKSPTTMLVIAVISLFCGLETHAEFPKPGEWNPVSPTPSPNYMNGVAYGDGLWVAVGDFGKIATSTDGIHWTNRDSSAPKEWAADESTGNTIASVAYGEGKWAACGSSGRVYTSDNGIDWTNRVVLEAEGSYLDEIVYANNLWVMTGTYQGVLTSPDGETWTPQPIDQADWAWALGYGDGQWVCVDYAGRVFTSTDGISWAKSGNLPVMADEYMEDIHFANGLWVAGGSRPDLQGPVLYSSADLSTWTERYSRPLGSIYSVDYANGLWVACGGAMGVRDAASAAPYEVGLMLTSTDGIAWTVRSTFRKTQYLAVAYGGGRWVAGSSAHGGLAYSDNGIDWQSREDMDAFTIPFLYKAAYHDGMWIAGLQDGTIWQSTDGQHWASRVLDASNDADWLTSVLYSESLGKWVLGGDFGKLWTSPDGYSWTRESVGIRGTEGMAEGGGKLMAAGRLWDLYASTDGENWTEMNHPQKGVAQGRFYAVHHAEGTWAVVGTEGVVVYSKDNGATWSKSVVGGRETLKGVQARNGLWVVSGNDDAAYWSNDLLSWTKITLPASNYTRSLTNIEYLDSTWIMSGWSEWENGHIYTSTDGKSWNAQPPILFPSGAVKDILKVDDEWYLFGTTMIGMGFVMSTADFSVDEGSDRSLIFKDPESYTVTDTSESEQFTSLPLAETMGGSGATLYLSFKIKRESGFGQFLDFTGLQLSRSTTNLPSKDDLGFGNSGPTTYFGMFVEGRNLSLPPDVEVPLDNAIHTVIARIDYAARTVAMVTDPQSVSEIDSATRYDVPTNPFSALMLRAGHNNTSYSYSRIALGESAQAVLDFTQETGPPSPDKDMDPGNFREWEWKNPKLTSEDYEDVAYGGGRYVAVSRKAHIIWSDDGVVWQHAADLPRSGTDLYAVAYGGGRWVAAGANAAYTSTDGVHWEDLPEFHERDIDAIAFHNTRWVMVGDGMYTSRNGTVWEEVAGVSDGYLRSVAYGNNLWVVASVEGEVLTSTDGVTWTQRREPPAEREWIQKARYADGRWFLAGANLVVTSTDGISWTAHAAGDPSSPNQLYDVIPVGDGRWLALGWNRVLADGPDNWSTTEIPSATMVAAAFGNADRVVFVGEEGGVHTTTNLNAWASGNDSALQSIGPGDGSTAVNTITEFAYGNGIWLASSSAGSLTSQLWRSTDGDDYSLVALPTPGAWIASLSYGEGEFLATTVKGMLFTSRDGLVWRELMATATPSVPNGSHVADGQRVIVGGSGVFYGPAGSNAPLSPGNANTNTPLHAVTFGNGTWVAVGALGTVLTATSPDQWVKQSVPALGDALLEHVTFTNGRFFIGGSGVVVTSTDGSNWVTTNHDLFAGEIVTGFAYHPELSEWYSASYDESGRGWLYGSEDGLAWRFLASVSRRGHRHLVYADGQLVLAGEGGQIMAHGTPTPVIVTVPPLSAFEQWMNDNNILSPDASALETYALAKDRGAPAFGVDYSLPTRSRFSAKLRKDLEGIQVVAEYSSNLIDWQDVSDTAQTSEINADMNEHVWHADKDASGTGYLRLKIILKP